MKIMCKYVKIWKYFICEIWNTKDKKTLIINENNTSTMNNGDIFLVSCPPTPPQKNL